MEHPDTLADMAHLADLLSSQDKYEEAESLHRQTLSSREKVLGKEHPDTLRSMNGLAEVLKSQGRDDASESFHEFAPLAGTKQADTSTSMRRR